MTRSPLTDILIFYTESLIGKVVLWCFFSGKTSEKIHNSTFQISSQNLSKERNFFKWVGKETKILHLLFHRIWKISFFMSSMKYKWLGHYKLLIVFCTNNILEDRRIKIWGQSENWNSRTNLHPKKVSAKGQMSQSLQEVFFIIIIVILFSYLW